MDLQQFETSYVIAGLLIFVGIGCIFFATGIIGFKEEIEIKLPFIGRLKFHFKPLSRNKKTFVFLFGSLSCGLGALILTPCPIKESLIYSQDLVFAIRNQGTEPGKNPVYVGDCGYIPITDLVLPSYKSNNLSFDLFAGYYAKEKGSATITFEIYKKSGQIQKIPFSVSKLVDEKNYNDKDALTHLSLVGQNIDGEISDMRIRICPGQWAASIMDIKVSTTKRDCNCLQRLLQ